tara:strand:+ start:210 stop:1046 length:837 start_codon:yes stop_codon:yes gene_type:complete
MRQFQTKSKLTRYLNVYRNKRSIGLVPTMGALHSGHLALIKAAKKKCDIVVCSIFVNPMQFNNIEDFTNYPNTINKDLEKLKTLNCNVVYTPKINDIYAQGENVKEFNFGPMAENMEGKFRPGHFNGMATIVEKLFNIILPTQAFFGQKDLQQLQLIKALVQKMGLPIEIISITTYREKNGLAKSSRNQRLSKKAKNKASIIYNCLKYCAQNKHKGVINLKLYIQNIFKSQKYCKLEYAEIVDIENMLPINKWGAKNKNAICIATHIEGVRLIDNIIL